MILNATISVRGFLARKGDICLYSLEQQRKRRANKKNPGFLSGVSRLWSATKANMDRERVGTEGNAEKKAGELPGMAVGIDKASFIGLMVKIQYLVICPPVSHNEPHSIIADEVLRRFPESSSRLLN